MFGDIKIIGAITGVAFGMFLWMPILGFAIAAGYLLVLAMMIKVGRLDVLLSPLAGNEVLLLWVTKSRRIVPEIAKEDQGYVNRRDWGMIKVAENTDHTFCGKKALIAGEGIPYSVKLEELFVAKLLAKTGIHTKAELAAFLDVPLSVVDAEVDGMHVPTIKREVETVAKKAEKAVGRSRKETETEIPEIPDVGG